MSLSSPLQRSAHLLRQRSRSPLCLLSSRLPVVGHPVYGFALLSVLFNTVSSLRARGTDSPPAPLIRSTSLGTFAHYTLTERMPAVARRIVKVSRVFKLAHECLGSVAYPSFAVRQI